MTSQFQGFCWKERLGKGGSWQQKPRKKKSPFSKAFSSLLNIEFSFLVRRKTMSVLQLLSARIAYNGLGPSKVLNALHV